MWEKHSLSLIFLAGGQGSRIPLDCPKQFLPLHGKPMARYSFDLFLGCPFKEFIVVCPEAYRDVFATSVRTISYAIPGHSRMLSVASGLDALTHPVDFILTHDAARPFLEKSDLIRLVNEGLSVGAATLATPLTSTIKRSNHQNLVIETLARDSLWETQTPQLIKYSLLKKGLDQLIKENLSVTDEMLIAEMQHHPVKLIPGNPRNFKITTMQDLLLAQMLTQPAGSLL